MIRRSLALSQSIRKLGFSENNLKENVHLHPNHRSGQKWEHEKTFEHKLINYDYQKYVHKLRSKHGGLHKEDRDQLWENIYKIENEIPKDINFYIHVYRHRKGYVFQN